MLPPVAAINGARIRVLTGDDRIPDSTQISLRAFRAVGARDTETYQSIIKSFVRLDLESVGPPDLPDGWSPEVTIMPANVP
jgi:hypothetical protein